MLYVIGSGPAGVACALGLVENGYPVTMLDVGLELPFENRKLVEQAQTNWNPNHINLLKHRLNRRNPIKLSYNSNFHYAEVDNHFEIKSHPKVHVLTSFARGGLSHVWGAVLKKYSADDFSDWPISLQELEPYYAKVLNYIPWGLGHASQQAKKLMDHWITHQDSLNKQGIEIDIPELAVNFHACRYCGNCQHGCPGEFIYNASHTLNLLLNYPNFHYKNNVVVTAVQEFGNQIVITAHHRATKEKLNFEGSRVFMACGPLISSMLYLRSSKRSGTLTFHDSSHFMLPCLMRNRVNHVEKEALHTLCQSLIRLNNKAISDDSIALQLYTYMDHYQQKLNWLPKNFLDRFIVFQGFLHSNHSHRFALNYSAEQVFLQPILNSTVNKTIQNLTHLFKLNNRVLGFNPIKLFTQISKIGKSFHYGASLPMRDKPNELETDSLGRPCGYERWHIVDTSIFPSIPAGPITLTMMANAFRIAQRWI